MIECTKNIFLTSGNRSRLMFNKKKKQQQNKNKVKRLKHLCNEAIIGLTK